jgi:hypothetical protein
VIDNSQVSLTSVVFTNNVIGTVPNFPNLRHNVFVSNKSVLSVSNLLPDTYPSSFIYVADDYTGGSVVSGTTVPLFVPRVTSTSPSALAQGISTDFVLKGSNLYPCGLSIAVYKGNASNMIVVCFVHKRMG